MIAPAMPARPVIALLTDFGTSDHYVAVMKAVMLGIQPEVSFVDLTHEIPPQDVRAAAFTLAAAWREFPLHTVFLVVVDPGVGTERAAIAARVGDQHFVGPDNGVFDLVLTPATTFAAVRLETAELARPTMSRTFEGRDRFAPAAAYLASGVRLEAFGAPISISTRLAWAEPQVQHDRVVGHVVHVDRFGNLITDLHADPWAPRVENADVWVTAHGPLRFVRTYGDAPAGSLVALFGSTGLLEVAVVGGSAARVVGVGAGAEVHLRWRA